MPSPPRERPKRRGRRHCCWEEAGEDFNHHDHHEPQPGSCSHLLWELNHCHIFLAFSSVSTSPFSTHSLYIILEGWHKPEGREAQEGSGLWGCPQERGLLWPQCCLEAPGRMGLGPEWGPLALPKRVWSGPGRLTLGLAMLSSVMATASDPIAPPMYSAHGAPGLLFRSLSCSCTGSL